MCIRDRHRYWHVYGIYAPCNYLKNGWGKRYAKPGSNGYRNVSTNRPIRYMGIG